MKYEPKKELKSMLGTKKKPVIVELPVLRYLAINGVGDPNDSVFQDLTQALYAVMYTLKFAYKKRQNSAQYEDFVVGPLMGLWSISKEAQQRGNFTKSDFVYQLRIPLPPFITDSLIQESKQEAKRKKGIAAIDDLQVVKQKEKVVGQILHVGSYDSEQESFAKLDSYLLESGWQRTSKDHVEIYLSDPRRVSSDKLKTILQVSIEKNLRDDFGEEQIN